MFWLFNRERKEGIGMNIQGKIPYSQKDTLRGNEIQKVRIENFFIVYISLRLKTNVNIKNNKKLEKLKSINFLSLINK